MPRRPHYAAVLDDDPVSDEILWEMWVNGFGRAADLRPQCWIAIEKSGEEDAKVALAGLLHLVTIALDQGAMSEDDIMAFDETGRLLFSVRGC